MGIAIAILILSILLLVRRVFLVCLCGVYASGCTETRRPRTKSHFFGLETFGESCIESTNLSVRNAIWIEFSCERKTKEKKNKKTVSYMNYKWVHCTEQTSSIASRQLNRRIPNNGEVLNCQLLQGSYRHIYLVNLYSIYID